MAMNSSYRYDNRIIGTTPSVVMSDWNSPVGIIPTPGRGYSTPMYSAYTQPRPVKVQQQPVFESDWSATNSEPNKQQRLAFTPLARPTGTASLFTVDHLATLTLPPNQPNLSPATAVRRLYEMDTASGLTASGTNGASPRGIFTLRVLLRIEPHYVVVIDEAGGGNEMERFPISLVSDPACVTPKNKDANVRFDNIVLFTVLEDPGKGSPAEMHLFQCLGGPGQKIVDEIISAMTGKMVASSRTPPIHGLVATQSRPDVSYVTVPRQRDVYRDVIGPTPETSAMAALKYEPDPMLRQRFRQFLKPESVERRPPEVESSSGRMTERCIMLLDHCFNDLESFVTKLQQAAFAYKELDKRKTVRGNKNNRQIGGIRIRRLPKILTDAAKRMNYLNSSIIVLWFSDGLLGKRSQPPPAREFVDVLQKFKLSFILLAKLKMHIRDPNAPELVHFLFNPLGLVVEASRGAKQPGVQDLAVRVVSPLLTNDAVQLLDNCLTTKEMELWKSLGPAWTLTRDEWEGDVLPYVAQFYDGWQAPSFWLEELGISSDAAVSGPSYMSTTSSSVEQHWWNEESGTSSPYQEELYKVASNTARRQQPVFSDSPDSRDGDWNRASASEIVQRQQQLVNEKTLNARKQWFPAETYEVSNRSNLTTPNGKQEEMRTPGSDLIRVKSPVAGVSAPASMFVVANSGGAGNASDPFMKELIAQNAKIFKIIQDRTSSNSKELTVQAGEIVEVASNTARRQQPVFSDSPDSRDGDWNRASASEIVQRQQQLVNEKTLNARKQWFPAETYEVSNRSNLTTPNGKQEEMRTPGSDLIRVKSPVAGVSAPASMFVVANSGGAGNASDPFMKELIAQNAKIFKIIQDRTSSNSKELTVQAGEIVEVLEDSRNWWKVRNRQNNSGFVPKTILEKM